MCLNDPGGAAEERDLADEERDHAGQERDRAGGQRDWVAHQRDLAGEERDHAGQERDRAGGQRDRVAHLRDQVAERWDQLAERRDQLAKQAEARDSADSMSDTLSRSSLARRDAAADRRRASHDRAAGAGERTDAELDRGSAQTDRTAGAGERTDAGTDRDSALSDRTASATDRNHALVDAVTGVYLRGPGFVELAREIARATRTQQPLVLAFIDVDGLKAINDSRGHAAGDRMLRAVADTLRGNLRPYDVIIRYGGDEFLCVLPGLSLAEATKRFTSIDTALAEHLDPGSVSVGIADFQHNESLHDLVGRADAALYRERGRRQ